MTNGETAVAAKSDKRKKNLKRILYVLAAIFIILLLALLYYLFTQRPITQDIPGAPKEGPRFVKSVFGDFTDLQGVAVNRKGDKFFVVDSQAAKIWMVNKNGRILGSFGKRAEGPETEDGFGAPLNIAVGPKDEVYVTDRMGARILVFNSNGKFIKRFRPLDPAFEWSPIGIAVDSQGNVYVADAKKDEHRVVKFDKNGKVLMTFGKQSSKKGEFNYPNGIAVDKAGDIYVVDSNNSRVQIFNKNGKFLRTFSGTAAGALTHPMGIDVSRTDEIHVVESFGHDIQVYDKKGANIYNFGQFGIADGQFRYPKGIAIGSDGTVFVTDHDNLRIQIWKY